MQTLRRARSIQARAVEFEWGRPLGAVLEDLRLRRRLSQVQVARMLGVSQSTISIWERECLDGQVDANSQRPVALRAPEPVAAGLDGEEHDNG